jgi:predicted dehydrogenase
MNAGTADQGPNLRWGILGCAGVARKNWQAIRRSGNGTLVAVASRDAARARGWVDACQALAPFDPPPRAFGSYEELLAAPEVEAVYIPLPTGMRKEWVIRAAQAGKHVICEKPCAINAADLREMLDACQRHRVQFMDGVMFPHSARFARIREIFDAGNELGRVRRLTNGFSFRAPDDFSASNIRGQAALEPHGCLGDLGWYCLRLALWTNGGQMPRTVTGRLLAGGDGGAGAAIPTEFSAECVFEDGFSSGFFCSFRTEGQQWAHFSGEKGTLHVEDFVLPFAGAETAFELRRSDFHASGCDVWMEPYVRRENVPGHDHGSATAQEARMFRAFAAQARSGEIDASWPDLAWKTQLLLDTCLLSARAGGTPMAPAAR